MSEMYNRIEKMCSNNYMDVTSLCRELNIPRSSLSELKSGRAKSISADKVSKIATFFHVSASFITDGVSEKFKDHFIPDEINEDIKAENRNIVSQYPKITLEECLAAEIKVLECLFSRNLRAVGYDPNFITFERYVSLMLGQKHTEKNLHPDIYKALVDKYGVEYGMVDGTSYIDDSLITGSKIIHFNNEESLKIALWGGDSDIVDDEMLEDIMDFAKLLAEKKKKKMGRKE